MKPAGSVQPIGRPTYEDAVDVEAPPAAVWSLVADITRTPEYSPVVQRSEWLDGATGATPGARFRGHNRFNGFRWSRDCVVSEAEPARVFAFSTLGKGGEEQTRWRYSLDPRDGGTHLSLAYEIVSTPRWVQMARMMPGGRKTNDRQARWNISESLRRIADRVTAAPR